MKYKKDDYKTFGRKNPVTFRKPEPTCCKGLYNVAIKYASDDTRQEIVELTGHSLGQMFCILTIPQAYSLAKWMQSTL